MEKKLDVLVLWLNMIEGQKTTQGIDKTRERNSLSSNAKIQSHTLEKEDSGKTERNTFGLLF